MIAAVLMALSLQTPPALTPLRPRPARAVAPPPAQLVARALDAVGGAAAVRDVPAVTAEFYTVTFGLGQEETPASPARASVNVGRTVTDWRRGRRVQTSEVRGPGGMVTRQRRVTAGGIGMLDNQVTGAQQPDPPGVVANVARLMRLAPERLLVVAWSRRRDGLGAALGD